MWQRVVSVGVILTVILISFSRINQIFFQQDEWLGLGGAIYKQESFGTPGALAQIFDFQNKNESTRFLPVTSIANYLLYTNFKLNTGAYGILALGVIIVCALLINGIIYRLTNSYLISTSTSVLWVTNNLSYQAFTWIATMMPSLLSMLFFLLGLYFLLGFNEKNKKAFFLTSIFCMTLSLLSKETGIFYFITYSLIVWFFFKESFEKLKKVKLSFLLFVPILIGVFIPRLIFLFYNQSNFSPSVSSATKAEIVYNFFLIPARTIFHVYFPQVKIYELAYLANTIHYGAQTNGFVVESIVADAFSLLAAFYILLITFLAVLLSNENRRKYIYLSLISLFASVLPFIVFKSDSVVLETRFYIFPVLWSSLLFAFSLQGLLSKVGSFSSSFMCVVVFPIILHQVSGIHKQLSRDIAIGNYRKNIINSVYKIKPQLKDSNIFYFFTKDNGFYEFQSGFGQVLAVLLYDSGKIPKEILIDRDYWEPAYEGLKSFGKKKFGYFMTYSNLVESLKKNTDVSVDSVHSFYWDQQAHTVENRSGMIREQLKREIADEEN